MIGHVAALATSGTGFVATALGVLAQSPPSGGGGLEEIAPFLSGGGAAAAVGGLVYVTRKLLNGELVPRSVAERENELSQAVVAAGQREAKYMEVAEKVVGIAEAQQALTRDSNRALWSASIALGGPDGREGPRYEK